MGIFFDDWQACLRSHYIYVIRAGDAVTEPTLRHVLLHSGVDESELEALRAEAEALGPLDPDAPSDAAPDPTPEQDVAPAGDPVGDNLAGDVDPIAAPEAALDEAGAPPDGDDGEPDGAGLDGDDEGDIPGDDLHEDDAYEDDEPPVAPNQLSLF